MAEYKKSFILLKSTFCEIDSLSDCDAGNLFISILHYVNNLPVNLNDNSLSRKIFDEAILHIEQGWSTYNPKTKRYHWNYKGGISEVNHTIRTSGLMLHWRRQVFERDQFTCQECKKVGGTLNAHHIKEFSQYPELRFEVNNGLTLCKSCHNQIHRKTKV